MKINAEFLYEISSQLLSFNRLCDYLGLDEKQRRSPQAGEWLIELFQDLAAGRQIKRKKPVKNSTGEANPLIFSPLQMGEDDTNDTKSPEHE